MLLLHYTSCFVHLHCDMSVLIHKLLFGINWSRIANGPSKYHTFFQNFSSQLYSVECVPENPSGWKPIHGIGCNLCDLGK